MKYLLLLIFIIGFNLTSAQVKELQSFNDSIIEFIGVHLTKDKVIEILEGEGIMFYNIENQELSKPYPYQNYPLFKNGISTARLNEKEYYINTTGKPIIKQGFDKCYGFLDGIAIVEDEGKMWLINEKGKPVFKGKYDNIHSYTSSIALVEKESIKYFINLKGEKLTEHVEKWERHGDCYIFHSALDKGMISPSGKLMTNEAYTNIEFALPLIHFETPENKGFLNFEGKEVHIYQSFINFKKGKDRNSHFQFYKDGQAALANAHGKLLSDYEFIRLRELTPGLILATKNLPDGERKGVLDTNGNLVVDFKWRQIRIDQSHPNWLILHETDGARNTYENLVNRNGEYFLDENLHKFKEVKPCNDNLAVVRLPDTAYASLYKSIRRYTLVNRDGKQMIDKTYGVIGRWKGGIARAGRDVFENGKYKGYESGYLRSNGEFVKVDADRLWDFKNGYAFFRYYKSDYYGLIDSSFKFIIPKKAGYTRIKGISADGIATVKKNSKWGYVNHKGKEIVAPQYRYAKNFKDGLAAVGVVRTACLINKVGDTIINYENKVFKNDLVYHSNLLAIEKEGKWGYINKEGEMVVPYKYDGAGQFFNGYAPVVLNDKAGAIDSTGAQIAEPQYKRVEVLGITKNGETILSVQFLDDKYSLIDSNGKNLLPSKYEMLRIVYDSKRDKALAGNKETWQLIVGTKDGTIGQLFKVFLE